MSTGITVRPDELGFGVEFNLEHSRAFAQQLSVAGRESNAQGDVASARLTGQALIYQSLLLTGVHPEPAAEQAARPAGLFQHDIDHDLSLTHPAVNIVGTQGVVNTSTEQLADRSVQPWFLMRCGANLCALADAAQRALDPPLKLTSPWSGGQVVGLALNERWGMDRVRSVVDLADDLPDPRALDISFDNSDGQRAMHLTAVTGNHTTTHSVAARLAVEEGLVRADLKAVVTYAMSGGGYEHSGMREQPPTLGVITRANKVLRIALEAQGLRVPLAQD